MTEPDKGVSHKTNHSWVAIFYWWCVIAGGGALGYLSRMLEADWIALVAKIVVIVGVIGMVAFIVMEKVHIAAALMRLWKDRKGQ